MPAWQGDRTVFAKSIVISGRCRGSPVTCALVRCARRNAAAAGLRCLSLIMGSISFSARCTEAARYAGSNSIACDRVTFQEVEVCKRQLFFRLFMSLLHMHARYT